MRIKYTYRTFWAYFVHLFSVILFIWFCSSADSDRKNDFGYFIIAGCIIFGFAGILLLILYHVPVDIRVNAQHIWIKKGLLSEMIPLEKIESIKITQNIEKYQSFFYRSYYTRVDYMEYMTIYTTSGDEIELEKPLEEDIEYRNFSPAESQRLCYNGSFAQLKRYIQAQGYTV